MQYLKLRFSKPKFNSEVKFHYFWRVQEVKQMHNE